jgi:uncharacterized protein (DUF1697 family)
MCAAATLDAMSVKYVAFLRGINLGKRRVKNTQLSAVFESLGFEDIKVLIASGNVVFSADKTAEATLTRAIEDALEAGLGFQVSTMVRSGDEIQAMIDADPFKGIDVTKQTRRYVTLLAEKSEPSLKLPYTSDDGNFLILSRTDREVYSVLTVQDGARTVDLMAVLEKDCGKRSTTRNWNTIVKAAAV